MLLLLTPCCNNHFRRRRIISHTVRRRGRLLGRYPACRIDPSPSDASPGASAGLLGPSAPSACLDSILLHRPNPPSTRIPPPGVLLQMRPSLILLTAPGRSRPFCGVNQAGEYLEGQRRGSNSEDGEACVSGIGYPPPAGHRLCGARGKVLRRRGSGRHRRHGVVIDHRRSLYEGGRFRLRHDVDPPLEVWGGDRGDGGDLRRCCTLPTPRWRQRGGGRRGLM